MRQGKIVSVVLGFLRILADQRLPHCSTCMSAHNSRCSSRSSFNDVSNSLAEMVCSANSAVFQ